MSSEFGNKIRVSLFGESHGEAVGVVISGLPAGIEIDREELQKLMNRRSGGKELATARTEADMPRFISGINNGVTEGTPVCMLIENGDAHSSDYSTISDIPRPGHADFTAYMKWHGFADMRGGGHFSGRLTAPLCAAGSIALQELKKKNIFIGAHLLRVAGIEDDVFPLHPQELFESISNKEFPVIDDEKGTVMQETVRAAQTAGDSVGAVIECAVTGLPSGLGEPMFDGIESRLAQVIFGIPAIKGVEFGSGFLGAEKRGSENNDEFIVENGEITSASNNCGGILGGITNGMPLVFKAAVKPTPSIECAQKTVCLTDKSERLISVSGRHDACIGIRAVPVIEAVAALVVYDILCEGM